MTLITRSRGRNRSFGAFTPSSLFLDGIQGAWYDPSDMTTLFQDSAGTTPVTAVEQPVGRILDKSGRGNHATQSTAASRPVLRARYNLLTYSEDFGNAAWILSQLSVSANSQTAPDGTVSGDTLVESAVAAWHGIYQLITLSGTNSFSIYVKGKDVSRWAYYKLYVNTNDWVAVVVNPFTGVVTQSSSGSLSGFSSVTTTSTPAPNGWFRIVTTFTRAVGAPVYLAPGPVDSATPTFDADGNRSYLGDGTSGIYVWGAQLLTAADATATGNAYQRIADAATYATGGVFRPYLAFDGVDDALATNAVDFTATDKMSVFAGANKTSDAALGILSELSADTGANAGAFYIAAPETVAPNGDITFRSRGSVDTPLRQTVVIAAPVTVIITATGDIPGSRDTLRVNSITSTSISTHGTGTYGNYPLFIGRRNNTVYPFNGRIYGFIVRGAASSTVEVAQTESWLNAKTGAY